MAIGRQEIRQPLPDRGTVGSRGGDGWRRTEKRAARVGAGGAALSIGVVGGRGRI